MGLDEVRAVRILANGFERGVKVCLSVFGAAGALGAEESSGRNGSCTHIYYQQIVARDVS